MSDCKSTLSTDDRKKRQVHFSDRATQIEYERVAMTVRASRYRISSRTLNDDLSEDDFSLPQQDEPAESMLQLTSPPPKHRIRRKSRQHAVRAMIAAQADHLLCREAGRPPF